MLCLHSDTQFSAKEELLEDDVTDFVLREIEGVDTFRVEGKDMPDVHLNERENVVLPDNLKNILTNSCDIDASCSSSTSTINALPVTSTGISNSNGLSSREANAICIVFGEISPLWKNNIQKVAKREGKCFN